VKIEFGRPELGSESKSPVLRAGVPAQKIFNSKNSVEFSPTNCKGVKEYFIPK
jgi:hypothetical protein